MKTVKTFEEGKTYYTRSACDHNCIFTIEVVRRTAKTVTYKYLGLQRRSNIKLDENGNEWIRPDNYSMAPVFRAERPYEVFNYEEAESKALADIDNYVANVCGGWL